MEMKKVLLIEAETTGGVAPIKVLDFDTKGDSLAFFYKHVECDLVDIVSAYALADNPILKDISLVVDDEGLCKGEPKVNILGSLLYGMLEHQQPLVGKVLVCKDVHTPDGIEAGGLTDDEISLLDLALHKLVRQYNEEVMRRTIAETLDEIIEEPLDEIGYGDAFFVRPETETVDWMYYNPDSSAGGQYVINHVDYDVILEAAELNLPVQEFFDYLGSECRQELADIDTECFEAAEEEFRKEPTFAGCTEETMLALIKVAAETLTEE